MNRGYYFCICLLLILALPWFAFSRQPEQTEAETFSTLPPAEPTVPAADNVFYIPNAPVALWGLGDYEGEFLEENSDEPVQCACLVLENTGVQMLEYVRIRLKEMVFEATCIPPGEKVLVLEKNKCDFSLRPMDLAVCEEYRYGEKSTQNSVYVSADGLRDLIVTNLTEEPLPSVQIRYKQYSPEAGLYWGGITYTAEVLALQPGESRCITPYRFLTDQGRIIDVSVNK